MPEANQKHYSENMRNKTAPYNGIIELLQQLKEENYKLAVVSNKLDKAVKELVQDFWEYIQVAIGETDISKTCTGYCFQALQELQSSAGKAIYVGDSEVDVRTAKNAGTKCVAVTWGFRDRDVLEREGADFIIDRPIELMGIIG